VIRFINWLDSIRFRYLDPTMWVKRNKRLGSRLFRDGRTADARIAGIRVTYRTDAATGSSPPRWEFALQVETEDLGTFRAGCRQQLLPHGDRVRLGQTVKIRYDEKRRVLIDWPATLEGWGLKGDGTEPTGDYRPLREPPPDGVEDSRFKRDRKQLERGERATAEVLDARQSHSALGPVANKDVDLRLQLPSGERREVTLSRVGVPEHAGDLLSKGSVLPVAVDRDHPEKVTIDWAAALVDPPQRRGG
jgi:hypothetical protein